MAAELSEYTRINYHVIKLVDNWQLPHEIIYSLSQVELEMLRMYIKNHMASGIIMPSKSFARAPIFFDKKSNCSLQLCVDYQSLNNLTIQNRYPLIFRQSLDWLARARWFI